MLLMELWTYCFFPLTSNLKKNCFNVPLFKVHHEMSRLSINQIRTGIPFTYICIFQRTDYEAPPSATRFEYQSHGSGMVPMRECGACCSSMQITNVLIHPDRLSYSSNRRVHGETSPRVGYGVLQLCGTLVRASRKV